MLSQPNWRRAFIVLPALACLTARIAQPASAAIINVPDDYPTIEQAINEAQDGDEVVVADGTYIGLLNKDLDFGGRLITVRSENGPENCIIDCENDGRGFYFHSGETEEAVVKGLTIRNGYVYDDGGGVYCEDYSSPTIINCTITANEARAGYGGGVYTTASSPTFIGCTITDNDSIWYDGGTGGGVFCGGDSHPTFIDCAITYNTAYEPYHMGSGCGGGLCCYQSSPTLIGCVIADNTADSDSGDGYGGGVYCPDSSPTLTNCTITRNEASLGAGLNFLRASPTLTDCDITDNSGIGLYCFDNSNPTLTNCDITANSGGGVVCYYNSSPTLTNCAISGNEGGGYPGGVVCVEYCHPTLTDCDITGNSGDGVECENHSDPTLTNCLITGNSNYGVDCHHSDPTLTNCVIWDDTIETNYSDPIVTYCDIEGGWYGEGNIDADPLFVDPDNGDYHLGDGSPCIDAGNNTAVPPEVTTDLDGNPRFRDDACTEDTGFGDPPIVDMGAYEFQPTCPSDFDCDGDVDTFDLLHLLGAWSTPDGDVDGDSDTDTADLLALLGAWGECP